MTTDRIARILRGYESWNREEPLPTDNLSPDFEFHPPPDLSGEPVQRGHRAGDAFREGLQDAFGSVRATVLDTAEREDHVIARVRIDVIGRHTGIDMSREEFHVYAFQGELVRSLRCFVDESEARAAVGDSSRSETA
jgi:hypothetical protein